MTIKYLLTLLTLILSINFAQAAGEPMNQDFTSLISASTEALEVGKQGKAEEFAIAIDKALEMVKDQKLNGDSPKLQRVGVKLKTAKKMGKEGNMKAATEAIEEALSIVK